jgi:predicted dehydrogenase
MREIKLGVVGFGGRGQAMFALATKMFPGVQATAVCDSSPQALARARECHPGARFFDRYDDMLEKAGLDALLVETPGDNHAVFCAKALGRGLNVMSDVPCVFSSAEAERLWAAERDGAGLFMFGANPNMYGFIQAAVDLKNQGLLGTPYYLEAEYIHSIPSLFVATPWRRTLCCIKYCTHSLGPLLRLVDDDIVTVCCMGTGAPMSGNPDYHDAMCAIFHTASNAVIRLTISFCNHFKGGCHSYRVFGTEGCFERFSGRGAAAAPLTLFNSAKLAGTEAPTVLNVHEMPPQYARQAEGTGHGGIDYALMDNFLAAVRDGRPSPISLREGLRMSLPGVFAAESAQRGGELLKITYPWTATAP